MKQKWMRLAIEQAERSSLDGPKVGVVVVKDGELLVSAYRGELGKNKHAEQCALEKLKESGLDPTGAEVYSTLEPCSELKSKTKTPCANQLVEAGVSSVYIGEYDRNPAIYREGWRILRDGGIKVYDFTNDERKLLERINAPFAETFKKGYGPSAGAKFDYSQNGGRFEIYLDRSADSKHIDTRWSTRGADSVYAYAGKPGIVALAKHVNKFEEIDNPDAYDYGSHSVPVRKGQTVIFRSIHFYALIRVEEVAAGPERGHKETSLKIQFKTTSYRHGGPSSKNDTSQW